MQFVIKVLSAFVAACVCLLAVGFGTVRNWRSAQADESALLGQAAIAFDNKLSVEEARPIAKHSVILDSDNLVVRERRPPRWIDADWIESNWPGVADRWFRRTTIVAIRWIPCLSYPNFTTNAPLGDMPSNLHRLTAAELQKAAERFQGDRRVEWGEMAPRLNAVRDFYSRLAKLTDLEMLRPGPLFGDDELKRFARHTKLRVLDLSPQIDRYTGTFHSAVSNDGLLLLESDFPALEYLMVADVIPSSEAEYAARQATLTRLLQRRPNLRIAYAKAATGRVWELSAELNARLHDPVAGPSVRNELESAAAELKWLAGDRGTIRFLEEVAPLK